MALLIANANHSLDTQIAHIEAAHKKAVAVVAQLLGLKKDVDIVCIADASMTIPEIGVGGYTPNRHLSYLYIDPSFNTSEAEIFNTLCHELHHAKRYEQMGYGETLVDSMIFEGLAIAFEEEISGKDAFMPSQLLARNNTKALIKKIKHHFNDKNFDHFRWFIFDDSGELPRWAGYEVGYCLVRQYLSINNKKASELVLEASSNFIS